MAGALLLGSSYLALGTVPFSLVGDSSGDGGTISINAERTTMQCAPDSVRFTVDLSSATFDTQGPTGSEVYDARLHDLVFLWDFDDAASGDWTAPVNVLSQWKNRNVAKGPFVAHMYTSPGTYNPSVLVIEPSSGKTATATLTGGNAIVVADPDTVYAGADTIVVNPVGDNTWTGEPSGASRVNADTITASTFDAYEADGPKRILFKRGEEFTLDQWNWFGLSNVLCGAYGSGAKPVLNVTNVTQTVASNQGANIYIGTGYPNGSDVRFDQVKILGDFDPTTEVDMERSLQDSIPFAVFITASVYCMMSRVDFDGIFSCAPLYGNSGTEKNMHVDDCTATNIYSNYPFFMSPNSNTATSAIMTGCRIAQPPGAHDTTKESYESAFGTVSGLSASTHSLLRFNDTSRIHVRGCDFFLTDRVHNAIRLNSGANRDGNITNVHSNTAEGGAGFCTFSGDPFSGAARSVVSNAIFDGNIYLGTYSTTWFMQSHSTGITARNNLAIVPDVVRSAQGGLDGEPGNAFFHWILMQDAGSYDSEIVGAAPARFYNNTFVFLQSFSENKSQPINTVRDDSGGAYTAIEFENNILHYPTYNPVVNTYAPLTTTQLPFTPRNIGQRIPYDMGTLVSGTDTTASDLAYYRPDTGSSAIGGYITGNKAYLIPDATLEISGGAVTNSSDLRPNPPSIGAWEPS